MSNTGDVVIMKRGMARLDESEGATAVRTGSSVLWRAEIQKHLGQGREVSGSRAEQEWTSGGRYILLYGHMQRMVHPTRVDEVAGAGGTDAQAGGAAQATSLVASLAAS